MFLEQLKKKISGLAYGSEARDILKVVLGELQRREFKTDQECHSMIKKMVKSNEENISLLEDSDPRKEQFKRENLILGSLLPQYWSEQDIRNWLQDEDIDVNTFPNEGAVMGFCMSKLKGEPVEGGLVKKVIHDLRN